MSLQLIFCVETNKNANSDWIYIQSLITYFYVITPDIKMTPIYMDGKNKYNQKKLLSKIEMTKKAYRGDESKVIYCFDTDDIFSSQSHKSFFGEVTKYCESNKYDLVWFCRDIEEVLTGSQVSSTDKVKRAVSFSQRKEYKTINLEKISSSKVALKKCNLFTTLNSYLQLRDS